MRDVVVVGAGPAGLLAAMAAAECGRNVLLLEKATKPGVKILISGGTRCNVANAADRRETAARFGHAGAFLKPAFRQFFRDDVVRLLAAEGVPVQLESELTGKLFPKSDRALDVQRAVVRRATAAGVELRLGVRLDAIEPIAGGGLRVHAGGATIDARTVVLAVGGQSFPKVGTTGDGYRIAAALGHTIVPLQPGLVPLRAAAPWVGELAGIVVPWARIAWRGAGGRRVERAGDLLFTHVGLSGPGPMDLSSEIARERDAAGATVEIDLAPERSSESLHAAFVERASADGARRALRELEWLPQRLALTVLARAGVPPERRLGDLARRERVALVDATKRLEVALAGTLGYDKAEVTVGGVALDEVDPATMASRRVPGLYLAGEVLDLDGPIGGFNFQAAFSTGHLAGRSAARHVAGA